MSDLQFLEEVENLSPSTSGFDLQSGHSFGTYLLEVEDAEDLQNAVTEVLGTTQIAPGTGALSGQLQRQPPIAHPVYPFHYAEVITNFRGVGQFTKTLGASEDLGAASVPGMEFFALYDQYWITVKYTPRPYPVLPDSEITVDQTGSWINDSGAPETYNFANEWIRYTDFDIVPSFEAITAQQGRMAFSSASSPPNDIVFSAMPKMYLPNSILKFRWYQIPFRYITSPNSYITGVTEGRSWLGRINQNEWNGYDVGSLLYLGYSYKKYTPPIQSIDYSTGQPSWEKLCDIEFTFLLTSRNPIGAGPSMPPTNGNYLVAGHNLQPWIAGDRKYYYAQTATSSPVPAWLSFPMELLFFDPDVPNGV